MRQKCVGEEGVNGWWTAEGEKRRMCVSESGRAEWGLSWTVPVEKIQQNKEPNISFIYPETEKEEEEDEEFGQTSGKHRATADVFVKHSPILGPE